MQDTPLNVQATIAVLERLMFSEDNQDKPSMVLPIDLAVLTYLILRRCVPYFQSPPISVLAIHSAMAFGSNRTEDPIRMCGMSPFLASL